ncbi:MAG: hypothetical protein H6Q38_126 [Chloroflexi bacterium]|nr:hypothetical protein [Chloroflexota bacterium]
MKQPGLVKLLTLNTYWFGVSFMWNSLHVIILPAVLLHLVSESYKNTILGLLTMAGLLIAMVVQPLSGAVSDRWRSRWGRRRPLMAFGTSLDFIFLAILAWAGGLGWLAVGYLGLQLSSNIAHGPAQGLIPDQVPAEKLGRASGLKNLLDIAGLAVSTMLMGRLLTMETRQPVEAVAMIAGVLIIAAMITLLSAKEAPTHDLEHTGSTQQALRGFVTSIPVILKSPFGKLIASRFLFLAGIYGIQVFALYYVRDVIGAANPIQLTANLLAVITVTLVFFALAGGWLGDRIGHQRIQYAASIIGVIGCLLMLAARTPTTLLAFGVVLGIGIGLFMTSNWALAIQNAPADQAGEYLGLTNLATAGAGALSRLQGPFIDGLNNAYPGAWWGYTLLFLLGATGIAVSAWALKRARVTSSKFHS